MQQSDNTRSTGAQSAASLSGQDARAPFLNPSEHIEKHRHNLPHWQQGEAWQFVTWRLDDSLPATKLDEWAAEKRDWLNQHPQPWDETTENEYHQAFGQRVDAWLDRGHGSCLLRGPACAEIVANALRHFDGQRYHLGPFVVMPNHVHVLFQPRTGSWLEEILHSWKSFTTKKINLLTGRAGILWQKDYWDRMIRHEAHWHACRRYIMDNPSRLAKGTFVLEAGNASPQPNAIR